MATETTKIIIEADDRASSKLSIISDKFKAMSLAVGAAGLALGGLAVKEAAKFEKQLSNISTLIDKDVNNVMKDFSDGILEIRKNVPTDPDELGAAAYDIVSAGITDAADAMMVLEQSARLGVAGLGSAKEATDLMTSSINAFQIPAKDANQVADVLFKTVKNGKTTISELAIGFGKVAPVAKSMSVSFEELQAATAAVTTTGIKASEVQTGLKAVMANLIKPTAELEAVYAQLGVTTGKELIEKSGGLVNALAAVKRAAEDQNKQFGEVISSVEALTVAESLLGAQNEAFEASLYSMTEGAAAVDEAFEKQSQTFDAQWQILKNQLSVILVQLGNKIIPFLVDAVKVATTWFNNNEDAVNSVVTVLGGAFKAGIVGAGAMISGFNELLKTWDEMWKRTKDNFVLGWNKINEVVTPIIDGISASVKFLINLFKDLLKIAKQAIDFVAGPSTQGAISSAANRIGGREVRGFANGGMVYASTGAFIPRGTDTVPAMLTPGELVLNAAQQKNLAGRLGGGGGTVIFRDNIISSKEAIMEMLEEAMSDLKLSTKVV